MCGGCIRGGVRAALVVLFSFLLEPDLRAWLCRWVQQFPQVFKNQFDVTVLFDCLPFELFQLQQNVFVSENHFTQAGKDSYNLDIDLNRPFAVQHT